jgi:hypothetical protein
LQSANPHRREGAILPFILVFGITKLVSKCLEVTDVVLVAKQVPHLIDITQLIPISENKDA